MNIETRAMDGTEPPRELLVDGKVVGEIRPYTHTKAKVLHACIKLGDSTENVLIQGFGPTLETAVANAVAKGLVRHAHYLELIREFAGKVE